MKLEQIEGDFFNLDLITSIRKFYEGPALDSKTGEIEVWGKQWEITFAGGESVLVSSEESNRILNLLK